MSAEQLGCFPMKLRMFCRSTAASSTCTPPQRVSGQASSRGMCMGGASKSGTDRNKEASGGQRDEAEDTHFSRAIFQRPNGTQKHLVDRGTRVRTLTSGAERASRGRSGPTESSDHSDSTSCAALPPESCPPGAVLPPAAAPDAEACCVIPAYRVPGAGTPAARPAGGGPVCVAGCAAGCTAAFAEGSAAGSLEARREELCCCRCPCRLSLPC
jgi:hypothetical protein